MLYELQQEVKRESTDGRAVITARFFKTGKGEYGEGDVFVGVTVPVCRRIAKRFKDLSLNEIAVLLRSSIHEERLVALLILINQYKNGDAKVRREIFDFYLKHLEGVNNWDLVDISAHHIVGAEIFGGAKNLRPILTKLSHSVNLWERRVAIVATFYFIKQGKFSTTFDVAKILLKDDHDLIHKAVGWMLREVGKRDVKELEVFLRENARYQEMPRTMLRYAIERFPEEKRKNYLHGNI